MAVVYHWRHGWIPLDHAAALKKAKGNHEAAKRMLADAPSAKGITSRQHVAKAALDLPKLTRAEDRAQAMHELRGAAAAHGATDLLPGASLADRRKQRADAEAAWKALKPGDVFEHTSDGSSGPVRTTAYTVVHNRSDTYGPRLTVRNAGKESNFVPATGETPRKAGPRDGAAFSPKQAVVMPDGKKGTVLSVDGDQVRVAWRRGKSNVAAVFRSSQLAPGDNPGGKALPADTVKLLRGGSAEKHLVTDASGTHFSAERTALHDSIIAKHVDGHSAQKNPAFVMLGGGPASGKTKAKDAAVAEFPDAVHIDPDEIKKMLPEYKQMTPDQAAAFVHEESSYLAKRITEDALAKRAHVVLDAVGDNSADSVRGKIAKARSAGYAVHGRYVTIPTEIAKQRAHVRGIKSGRVVHPPVVESLHSGVSKVFPEVMHDFDTAALYDNTTEWKQVLTKYRGQPEIVHDLQAWRGFLQKAG